VAILFQHSGRTTPVRNVFPFLFAAALSLLPSSPCPAAVSSHPNIVIILADDLGYGDVSCYGATRVKTPSVDRLASEGLRFTDAHSSSSTCTPSRYALLTGEYPWRKKGTGILPGDAKLIIQPDRNTLPAMLQKAGFKTGAIGKWHLGLGDREIDWNSPIAPGPREIGFDYSFIMPATGDRAPCVYLENQRVVGLDPADPITVSFEKKVGHDPTGRENPELLKVHPSHGHDNTIVNGISRIGFMSGGKSARWVDEDLADTLTKKAVNFITAQKDHPFFLYFATHDIHVPRVPNARFAGKTGLGPRGDVILQFDWSTGEIMKTLDRLKLAENTIVILTSDNGPVVDDGYKDQAREKLDGHRPAGPLRGGKYSAFEGGTRVPFILRWPGQVQPGTSGALVCQIDFLASFAKLTGQKLAANDAPDSLDLLDAFLGKSKVGRETLVEQSAGLALRQNQTKYIEPHAGPAFAKATGTETGNDPKGQLYQLDHDLGETNSMVSEDSQATATLKRKLDEFRTRGRTRR
jgi:arylsulfatase A-like enzyme